MDPVKKQRILDNRQHKREQSLLDEVSLIDSGHKWRDITESNESGGAVGGLPFKI